MIPARNAIGTHAQVFMAIDDLLLSIPNVSTVH